MKKISSNKMLSHMISSMRISDATRMLIIILECLSLLWCLVLSSSDVDINYKKLKEAQCRTRCLDQLMKSSKTTEQACMKDSACLMCWETCSMLHLNYDVWGPICGVAEVCLPGCQNACSFYTDIEKEKTEAVNAVQRWAFTKPLRFNLEARSDNVRVSWTLPVSAKEQYHKNILFVVSLRDKLDQDFQEWEELTQTTALNISVRRGLITQETDVKIAAITSDGKLAEKIASPSETNDASLLLEETQEASGVGSGASNASWRPRLISLEYKNDQMAVEATITWPALRSSGDAKYEVTWKVIDGAMEITGHLYTAVNVVTLNLWPKAMYSIQIRCFLDTSGVFASETLIVDTHGMEALPEAYQRECSDCLRMEILVGCAAGVSIFLCFLTMACLCTPFLRRHRSNNCRHRHVIRIKSSSSQHSDFQRSSTEESIPDEMKKPLDTTGILSPTLLVAQHERSCQFLEFGSGPISPIGQSRQELLAHQRGVEDGHPSDGGPFVFEFPSISLKDSNATSKSDDKV